MTKASSVWDWLNAINQKTEIDESLISEYTPFVVNRGLSYFNDTVLWANEMNRAAHLDKDQQFTFLRSVINKKKRFSKWAKAEKTENLEAIMQWYQVNRSRALELERLLTTEQVEQIIRKQSKGGRA